MFTPDALDQTIVFSAPLIPTDPSLPYNGIIFSGFVVPAGMAIQVDVRGSGFSPGFDITSEPSGFFSWAVWAPRLSDSDPFVPEYYEINRIRLRLAINCLPSSCSQWLPASDPLSLSILGTGTLQLATFRPPSAIPEPTAIVAFGLGLPVLIRRLRPRRNHPTVE